MELVKTAEPLGPSPQTDDIVQVGRCWRHGAVRVTEGAFGFPNLCPICSATLIALPYRKITYDNTGTAIQES